MTRKSRTPAKPHAKAKAKRERAVVAPYDIDAEWAAGIRRKLLAGCHKFQYDAVTDPARRYSWLVGRGGSKTTSFRVRGVLKLTSKAQAKVLYFAATRKRAKDLMWSPLKALLQRLGFVQGVDVVYNETELQCTIVRTGSIYQLAGLQDTADADKWRGDTWDEVQFDECGAIKPDLLEYTIYEVIGPRVHVIGLGGTPGRDRRKVFYEVTRPGSDKHVPFGDRAKYKDRSGYSSHHWTLEDVVQLPKAKKLYPELVRLWSEALVEKEANGWGDDHPIWLREYRAVWAADNTLRVFGEFRPELADGTPWNVWDPFDGKVLEGVMGLRLAYAKLREMFPGWNEWRFVAPEDMGGARERTTRSPHRDPTAPVGQSDPYACNVFALSPNDPERRIWHVMTFEKLGMHSKPIAELLIGADQVDVFVKTGQFPDGAAVPYGGVFGVVGWPDAMSFDTDNAHIAELANVYGIRTTKADKKPEYKGGAIELVNGDFLGGRIKVLKNSPLHQQAEQLQWKELDNGRLIEDPAQANHCLVAGTLIETAEGRRPIESVRAGDVVWTREGLRTVRWSGCTGTRQTCCVHFSNGQELIGTPDHLVWTERGWVELGLLLTTDRVTTWESTGQARRLFSGGRSTGAIQSRRIPPSRATTARPTARSSIAQSGSRSAAQSQRVTTSTTSTASTPTIGSGTWPYWSGASTAECTGANPRARPFLGGHLLSMLGRALRSGIDLLRGARGTLQTRADRVFRDTPASVRSAVPNSWPWSERPAAAAGGVTPERVVRDIGNRRVYDLEVIETPEFFANGVLVHNSTDTLVYGRQDIQGLFDAGLVVQDAAAKPTTEKPAFHVAKPPEISSAREADLYSDLLPVEDYADLDWG